MVAAANIAAAREQYRIQRAELFPRILMPTPTGAIVARPDRAKQ